MRDWEEKHLTYVQTGTGSLFQAMVAQNSEPVPLISGQKGVRQRFVLFRATLINLTILRICSIGMVDLTNRYIEF